MAASEFLHSIHSNHTHIAVYFVPNIGCIAPFFSGEGGNHSLCFFFYHELAKWNNLDQFGE